MCVGLMISGVFYYLINFLMVEQNCCVFVFDSGVMSDGVYLVMINCVDLLMLFVGNGVVGGGILGVMIVFVGILLFLGIMFGVVLLCIFDFYLFIGFIDMEMDFRKVVGNYNEVGIYLLFIGGDGQSLIGVVGWEFDVVNWNQMLNVDGLCLIMQGSDYLCQMIGMLWVQCKNVDGLVDNVFVSNLVGGVGYLIVGQGLMLIIVLSQVKGIMIVGRLNGVLVLIVICVGYMYVDMVNLFVLVVDVEVGILMLLLMKVIVVNFLKGGYIGVISVFVCGIVIFSGQGNKLVLVGLSFNFNVLYLDLFGIFVNNVFYLVVGSCNDGIVVLMLVVNYMFMLFQGSIVVFIDLQMLLVILQFVLDYMQVMFGKIKVMVVQDFNVKGVNGNVVIFGKGDMGWFVMVGNVYVMVVNNNKVNLFFMIGVFVQ